MLPPIAGSVGLHFLPMAWRIPFPVYDAPGIVLGGTGLSGLPIRNRSGMLLTGSIASVTVTGGAVLANLRGWRARMAA